jgi:hypothetical protein
MMRDRASLLDAIAEIEKLPRTAQHRLVLAEAEFRVAIAPSTPAAEAIERLLRAIEYDPYPAKLHLHLGRLLHAQGRQRAAIDAYRQAIRLAPRTRRARLLLALALLDLAGPEHTLGERLLGALSRDDAEAGAAVLADLDALRSGAPIARARPKAGGGTADTWRPALIEQLSRPVPAANLVAAHLDTGRRDQPASYATACVLMLAAGEPVDAVRRLMAQGKLAELPDDPAVVLLRTALDLAAITDPVQLVDATAHSVRHGLVPAELACWLYFKRHRDAPPPLADALRLLDAFPRPLRAEGAFRELRLAILDGYAREAWKEQRDDVARLLWQEMLALDPNRVAVARNLAVLAARARASSDYGPAWEYLTELLYRHSAGVGDLQLLLEERATLHLALAQQSADRYRAADSRRENPTDEELRAWLADRAALDVWLREWDLYYLNQRLRFRSAVHLLGEQRDATHEALAGARDVLVRHLDRALADRRWTCDATFRELATARVHEATRDAQQQAVRGTDPYHDLEKPRADALLEEVLQRALLLRRISHLEPPGDPATALRAGAAIAERQFALPLRTLQRLCVDRGLIEREQSLAGLFAADLTRLAARCADPEGRRAMERCLSALRASVTAAPHLVALRRFRCQLLQRFGRTAEARAEAVEALKLPEADPPEPDADRHRAALRALVDRASRGVA